MISANLAQCADKVKVLSINPSKIEIIKGKTQEKNMEITKKNFHGKVVTTHVKEKINTKPVEGNKFVQDYLNQVSGTILSTKVDSKKLSKKKLKGSVMAKIQIQKNGEFDVLFIQGSNPLLQSYTERLLEEIGKFSPIPKKAGQAELQIQIPINYNFSK
jgi:hypothetical protein